MDELGLTFDSQRRGQACALGCVVPLSLSRLPKPLRTPSEPGSNGDRLEDRRLSPLSPKLNVDDLDNEKRRELSGELAVWTVNLSLVSVELEYGGLLLNADVLLDTGDECSGPRDESLGVSNGSSPQSSSAGDTSTVTLCAGSGAVSRIS